MNGFQKDLKILNQERAHQLLMAVIHSLRTLINLSATYSILREMVYLMLYFCCRRLAAMVSSLLHVRSPEHTLEKILLAFISHVNYVNPDCEISKRLNGHLI